MATTIDNLNQTSQTIAFGEPGTASYGQTFTAAGPTLKSVEFTLDRLDGTDAVEYRLLITTVVTDANGFRPGTVLFERGTLGLPFDADPTPSISSTPTAPARPSTKSVPISSNKSMIGHTLTAAGAVEAVVSLLTIRNGCIPPTINHHIPDPAIPLDVVRNQARDAPVEIVLSNSFGFGGQNICLLFAAEPRP